MEKLLEVIADLQQPSLSATLSSGGGVAPSSSSQSTSVDESQMNALSNLSLLDTHSDPDILARSGVLCLIIIIESRPYVTADLADVKLKNSSCRYHPLYLKY